MIASEVISHEPVGVFQLPYPVMIGLPAFKLSITAFKLFNSVGILLPLRLLA